MPEYQIEITTPEPVPHDVLVEHLSYYMRAFLLAPTHTEMNVRLIGVAE